MKIQCNCGTKYAFDVTPEMAANPVTFICQNCGADNSLAVNMLIQQQFPATATESAPPSIAAASPPPPAESAPRARVAVHVATPARESESTSSAPAPQMCRKHPGHFTSDQCRVCNKPICPQCMVLFGYVCSAFCKNEAETRGIELPVYANQAGVTARRETRKLGKIIFSILGGVSLLVGVYIWYLAAGSRPHVVFATQFKNPAYNGSGKLYERDLVVLHGGRLARFDWKDKKEIWGVEFIDTQKIDAEAAEAVVKENAEIEQWKKDGGGDYAPNRHSKEEFAKMILSGAQSDYTLHVHEQNIWLRSDEKLVQYDWESGKPGKEVALKGDVERTIVSPDALLLFASTEKGEDLIKMDWKSGEIQTQPLRSRPTLATLTRSNLTNQIRTALAPATRTNALAAQRGAPVNPALKGYKVAQPDPLQVRLAAPAIAANTVQNKRIERALEEDEDERRPASFSFAALEGPQFILDRGNVVEFSTKLLERKIIERQAMKAPPKKSALEGTVNQSATVAIANEIFNEFAREATGGVEKEDVSRYEVTIKRTSPDASETKLEVTGEPEFFPLQTVDLIVAGKTLHVLDKTGKKLWESKLNFDIGGGFGPSPWGGDLIANASAPGVERDNLLYFFDQGVLACFELATGNARWRQPTVGVTKLLFDDKGMLYVDTTTGSADKLKYSQQVDISDKSYPVIIKIDPKTGKALWRSERHGRLSHVFGKLVYTMEWHGGDDDDESPTGLGIPGAYTPPHIRLRRLSASNGEVKWEHYQKRAPLNVDIQNNTIQFVFKKEVQVLKFIGL
jgi:hypothetical protein